MYFSEKCPICGTINHNLLLKETGGWFECEKCKALVNTLRVVGELAKVPLYRLNSGKPQANIG